jgi:hypothetical protein
LQRLGLDPAGDVQGLNLRERAHPVGRAPTHELADGAPVGFADIAVADIRSEEINKAPRGVRSAGGNERGFTAERPSG